MSDSLDCVVVGSGFGGAVTALRLRKAGHNVTIFERGRRWTTGGSEPAFASLHQPDYRARWHEPDDATGHGIPIPFMEFLNGGIPVGHRAPNPGLLERINLNGITVLAAAAFGGGSVAYGGMMLQPARNELALTFEGTSFPWQELSTHYETVIRKMGIGRTNGIRDRVLRNAKRVEYNSHRVFEKQVKASAAALGRYRLTLEDINTVFDWSIIEKEGEPGYPESASIGESIFGISSGAKRSLDTNYLAEATANGAHSVGVHTLLSVREIVPIDDGGFLLHCKQGFMRPSDNRYGGSATDVTYRAKRVFLCAGAMGSTRLLLNSKQLALSPAVGTRWGSNGDYLYRRRTLENTTVTQHGVPFRWRGGDGTWRKEVKSVNFQAFPPTIAAFHAHPKQPLRVIVAPAPLPGHGDRADGMAHLAMGIPNPRHLGNLRTDASGRLTMKWSGKADQRIRDKADRILGRLPGPKAPGLPPQTYHPLGGLPMGHAVDWCGRVLDDKRDPVAGLYVIDGSIIPNGHTGCANPALTIAAVAERCIKEIIEQDLSGDYDAS